MPSTFGAGVRHHGAGEHHADAQGLFLRCVRHAGRLAHQHRARGGGILKPLGHSLDWLAFADAWRGEYQPAMEEIRSGRLAFCKLDVLHRRNLEKILPRFGSPALSEEAMRHLNLAWHRLDAWPDSAAGPGAA